MSAPSPWCGGAAGGSHGCRKQGQERTHHALEGWLCSRGDGGVSESSHGAVAVVPVGNGDTWSGRTREGAQEGEAPFPCGHPASRGASGELSGGRDT